jgi:hypothetical protein
MKNTNNKHWVDEIIGGVQEGMRHTSAIRLVGRWYGKGMLTIEVLGGLKQWNKLNSPPMSESEIESIIRSTKNWENPRYIPPMSDEEVKRMLKLLKKEIRKGR